MEEKPQFQHPQPQHTAPASGQVYDSRPSVEDLMQQVAQLQQRSQNLRINFNTDIIGLFQTVSSAPTQVPNSPYQQVQIYSNGGTLRLYIYDAVGKAWHYASLT